MSVTSEELIQSLKELQDYLMDGGTKYRQQTVRMAISVAISSKERYSPIDFCNIQISRKIVKEYARKIDQERWIDVSKMLMTHANEIKRENLMSQKEKAFLEKRREERINHRKSKLNRL
ncbi:hypothetical protein GCM10008934_20970 [Virgibacillus salarius]|uniref:hypothetical protein n=1 Tax=Virgibacillus salarius TaxID=447199 RepID=UPI0031DDFDC2